MVETVFSYQKLDVWQMAKKLIVFIYEITRNFPQAEKYGLVSQINRAAISVASNIAEGSSRTSFKDQAHFTQTAYGSLMEVACQFEIAKDLGFIDDLQLDNILKRIAPLADKLSALRKSQLNRFTNKP
jgi:four helix bundle protein